MEKKAKRRQEFEAKIHTIKAKSLKGLEANANTSVPYVMQKSNSLIMMSKSGSSLDLHLDVLKSRLKDLNGNKLLGVLPTMEIEQVGSHCTEIMALFKVAFMISPSAGHGLDLVGGGRGPTHVMSKVTLLAA